MTVRLGLAVEEKRKRYLELAQEYRETAKTLRSYGKSPLAAWYDKTADHYFNLATELKADIIR